jgi:hypothetical protein
MKRARAGHQIQLQPPWTESAGSSASWDPADREREKGYRRW